MGNIIILFVRRVPRRSEFIDEMWHYKNQIDVYVFIMIPKTTVDSMSKLNFYHHLRLGRIDQCHEVWTR